MTDKNPSHDLLILIVDDDAIIHAGLKDLLEPAGYLVDFASTGGIALDKIQQRRYDLVLLDMKLPDMNGIQVLKHLQSDTNSKHIPVIVISSYNDLEFQNQILLYGAVSYLTKDRITKDLIQLLNGIFVRGKSGKAKNEQPWDGAAAFEKIKNELEKARRRKMN